MHIPIAYTIKNRDISAPPNGGYTMHKATRTIKPNIYVLLSASPQDCGREHKVPSTRLLYSKMHYFYFFLQKSLML